MNRTLFINNHDSFVYIIVDYFRQNDCKTIVVENTITLKEVATINPENIVISPGPGHPAKDTGNCIAIIKEFGVKEGVPIFGVCLGLQAIVEAFGGKVKRAKVGPMHGMVSLIQHDGKTIFQDIPNGFPATRYHSLEASTIPKVLETSAVAEDGTVMAVRHKTLKIEGVQFHPESILTIPHGMKLIQNFLNFY